MNENDGWSNWGRTEWESNEREILIEGNIMGLAGNVVLRKRLNYEDKTRYYVIIQANVSAGLLLFWSFQSKVCLCTGVVAS